MHQHTILLNFPEIRKKILVHGRWRRPANSPSRSANDLCTTIYYISLIIFLGQELEGEGNDRSTLSLPGQQLALLQEAVASGNTCERLFTPNEKPTDIQTIIFWVAWPQIDVFTVN